MKEKTDGLSFSRKNFRDSMPYRGPSLFDLFFRKSDRHANFERWLRQIDGCFRT